MECYGNRKCVPPISTVNQIANRIRQRQSIVFQWYPPFSWTHSRAVKWESRQQEREKWIFRNIKICAEHIKRHEKKDEVAPYLGGHRKTDVSDALEFHLLSDATRFHNNFSHLSIRPSAVASYLPVSDLLRIFPFNLTYRKWRVATEKCIFGDFKPFLHR